MNQETRRQHYVPVTYLKRFSIHKNKNFFVNAAEKNNLSKIFFPNINNICLETDLYTLSGKSIEERQALECYYSQNIEEHYDKIYKILIDKNIIEIDPEIHSLIIFTIITMLFRTSKWIHIIDDHIKRVLEKVCYLCNQHHQDSFTIGEKGFSIKGKTLKEIQDQIRSNDKDVMVLTQLDVAMKLSRIRCNDSIMVTKLTSDYHLCTSDHPVILENMDAERIVPFDPENILRLSLDSQYLLTIMPHSQSDNSHTITRLNYDNSMSFAHMIGNNSSQLFSCYKYILGTKKALTDYITTIDDSKTVSEEIIKILDINKKMIKNISQTNINDH